MTFLRALFGPPDVQKLQAKNNIKGLIRALNDEDLGVRRDAIKALGQIGDARAVEPLISALKDANSSVRRSAADALDNLGWQPDSSEVKAAYCIAKGQWEQCVLIGAPALEPLIAILNKDISVVRRDVIEALGQIGDARAVEPLSAVLKDWDWQVHQAAIEALGQIGDARAIAILINALQDTHLRQSAITALLQIGVAAADSLLAKLRNSKELRLNLAVYSALQSIPSVTIPENETNELIEATAVELRSLYSRSKIEQSIQGYRHETQTQTDWVQGGGPYCLSPRSVANDYEMVEETREVEVEVPVYKEEQVPDPDWAGIRNLISQIPPSLLDPILTLIPSDLRYSIQELKQ